VIAVQAQGGPERPRSRPGAGGRGTRGDRTHGSDRARGYAPLARRLA
jgi:hypothetical protein